MTGFTSISQMALAIRGRWKLGTAVALAVFVTLIAIVAVLPSRYTATAWVIFNNRGSDAIIDKNDSLGFAAYVNGEVDLIGSRRVLQRVANDPALLKDPRTLAQSERHQKGGAPLQDWLVEYIGNHVSVSSAKGVRTVAIAAEFDDPNWATLVANLIAKAYLDTAVDLKVAPARRNVAFFRAQTDARAAELATEQARLAAFLKETGMTGLEAKSDADELQLRTLAERLSATEAAKAGTSAQSGLGGIDSAVAAGTISNPVVQQLRAQIAGQSATVRDLEVLSGPKYPPLIQARERLAELEGQLAAELAKVARGVARTARAADLESAGISALEANKRAAITASSANRARLQVLTSNVERAKTNYDAVAARLAELELASAVEAPNAAILTQAATPRGPSFPNWPLVVLFAAAAALVAGLLAALIKELLVPRVRSRHDLQALLGAPVLCDLAG
jgi:succinoglycan biosynthesis transport protein ExoP